MLFFLSVIVATISLPIALAQLVVTQPTAQHWWVGGGLNTLAWTGNTPSDFQVFLVHPDVNVLTFPSNRTPTQSRPNASPIQSRPRRTKSEARGPPLGDPSLEYVAPGSDFIRLRSSRASSSKCVVVLDHSHKHKSKGKDTGKGKDKENVQPGEAEEEEGEVDAVLKNCLLTNGVLPLLRQTDRLALESIVPTYIKSKSINPGGANSASGYTLQLTNPLNSTDIYATSEPFDIKPPNSPYPSQETASASMSASGSSASVSSQSSSSSTSVPNAGSARYDTVRASTGVVLGFAAFGGMMQIVKPGRTF